MSLKKLYEQLLKILTNVAFYAPIATFSLNSFFHTIAKGMKRAIIILKLC